MLYIKKILKDTAKVFCYATEWCMDVHISVRPYISVYYCKNSKCKPSLYCVLILNIWQSWARQYQALVFYFSPFQAAKWQRGSGLKPHVHAVQCTRSTCTSSTPTSCSRRLSVRNVLYLFIWMGISMISAIGYYKQIMNTLIYAEHIYVILYIYINCLLYFSL